MKSGCLSEIYVLAQLEVTDLMQDENVGARVMRVGRLEDHGASFWP